MPLHKDYVDMVKGDNSDLKNHAGAWGGCSTAAAYLS
jgi:leucyl aminopeptidase